MRRAVRRVGTGSQCVRRDAKRGLRPAALALLGAEGASGETDLRRDEPCCGSGALVEAARDPEQLDAPVDLAAHEDGHDECALRPQASSQTGQGLRRLVELDLARRQLLERQAPTLELDRERRRRPSDRPDDQVTPVVVDDPRDDDVGSREACCGTDNGSEDVPKPAAPRDGPAGVRERFQRSRIEPGPLAPLRLHCHPAPPKYDFLGSPSRLRSMAQPERTPRRERQAPPVDPSAVARAYRLERAKRFARERRVRERNLADLRFWLVLVLLTSALLLLGFSVWNQVERLVGL